MKNWRQIAKAIAAWLSATAVAVGTWAGTLPEGPITTRGWIMLVAALVGPLLAGGVVYQVRNVPVTPA